MRTNSYVSSIILSPCCVLLLDSPSVVAGHHLLSDQLKLSLYSNLTNQLEPDSVR